MVGAFPLGSAVTQEGGATEGRLPPGQRIVGTFAWLHVWVVGRACCHSLFEVLLVTTKDWPGPTLVGEMLNRDPSAM